ncbi:hypothetical protein C8F04DRAFT_1232141 [Mycena alexandri]|uniref:Uncharacterized protein n=1 Tax=Mycena alexandri TaxID=1745969 RepID=A0AAD6T5M7_9AGAR|nr:hypothetical protein C8F04DRAFT_1232141 [Mycena alexandri]
MLSQLYVLVSMAILLAGQAAASPVPMPRYLARRAPQPLDTIPAYVKRDVPVEQASTAPNAPRTLKAVMSPNRMLLPAPNGQVLPYSAENVKGRRDVPVEQASTAPNGIVLPYSAQNVKGRDVAEQDAATAPNGQVLPYSAENVKGRDVAEQDACYRAQLAKFFRTAPRTSKVVMSQSRMPLPRPTGQVLPYSAENVKGRDVAEQDAATAPNGQVLPYSAENVKGRDVAEQDAATAPNGQVLPYSAENVKGRRDVPVEQASTAPNGIVLPYSAQNVKGRDVAEQDAATAPNWPSSSVQRRERQGSPRCPRRASFDRAQWHRSSLQRAERQGPLNAPSMPWLGRIDLKHIFENELCYEVPTC